MTPFRFHSEQSLVRTTGMMAQSLRALQQGLARASLPCIFFHVHHALFRRSFTRADFMNDFARWAWVTLHEEALAERLSVVDPLQYKHIREASDHLRAIVSEALGRAEFIQHVERNQAFYFQEAQTFICDTGLVAQDLHDFAQMVRTVRPDVIFHHFIEARLRLARDENDFSLWIDEALHRPDLAARLRQLSPYRHDLRSLRKTIADLCAQEA